MSLQKEKQKGRRNSLAKQQKTPAAQLPLSLVTPESLLCCRRLVVAPRWSAAKTPAQAWGPRCSPLRGSEVEGLPGGAPGIALRTSREKTWLPALPPDTPCPRLHTHTRHAQCEMLSSLSFVSFKTGGGRQCT